jgi:hypothetical protein
MDRVASMRRVRRVAGEFLCRISGGGEGGRNSEILKSCESALPRKGENLIFLYF